MTTKNYKVLMMKIAAENPLPETKKQQHSGAGPFTRDILGERLEAWKEEHEEFEFADTERRDGFQITCPGVDGWGDGEQHSQDNGGGLNDSTIVYVENGFPRFSCKHNACGEGAKNGKKTWADLQNYYDPERKLHTMISEDEPLDTSKWQVEEVGNEAEVELETAAEAEEPTSAEEKEETIAEVKADLDEILRPGKGQPPARERQRVACTRVIRHLRKRGKIFNVGNMAVFLDNESRKLVEVVRGGHAFTWLLSRYGILPTEEKLLDGCGKMLGALAVEKAPKTTIYTVSFYEVETHILRVNEFNGFYLKITKDGVERLRNGDENLLFSDGQAASCQPLHADLPLIQSPERAMNACGLYPNPDSLIVKEILDTINYSEHGIGKEHAHVILMTAIIALFFHERIPSTPFVYLYGPGATMKTSLAVKVGKLLQGPKFAVTPTSDEVDDLKILAMSNPFLVLDEANNIRKLANIMKAIGTGATDKRRELYTTAQQRETTYQARIWMTANTASLTNETISSRMMIIDAAPRTEAEPYRSDHHLRWTSGQRDALWTELVERLQEIMRRLAQAEEKGEADLHVNHRMSAFFVFGRVIARQEGWEDKFLAAMKAMEQRQMQSSAEGNDIFYLVGKLPKTYGVALKKGQAEGMRTADEWAEILSMVCPEANVELHRDAARPGWVRYQLSNNERLLEQQFGMVLGVLLTPQRNKIKTYGFTRLTKTVEMTAEMSEEHVNSATQT